MKSLIAATALCLAILGCSTTTPNSEKSDYELSSSEKSALGNGLVQLFSEDLPNYAYNSKITIAQDIKKTTSQVTNSINKYGRVKSNLTTNGEIEIIGRVGSGTMNMNPAGILIKLNAIEGGTQLVIRAVAKEGLVKQNTSGKAVERLISDIKTNSGLDIVRL